jgi:formate dehydrogenase major subunit
MTATSIGPDTNQVLQALSKLKWLVVMDPFPTTSSEFWHAPGIDPTQVQTEVFLLPATHWIEKDGSFVNSGRWMQWKDAVLPPQGQSMHDHWILAELHARVKDLYQRNGGAFPHPILDLAMEYKDPRKPTLDEIAQEVNGKDLKTGKRLATFAKLTDDGNTSAGNWIYTGSYPEKGNAAKRRNGVQDSAKNDPTGMGFFPEWAWSWPLNRRVLYNRASADVNGKPWDPKRPGILWNGSKWVGDVPDYPPAMSPHDPDAWLPFIMTGEGVGRIFSSTLLDGPFAEHYEPMESPVRNALHPGVSSSPVAFLYDKAAGREDRFGTPDEFPIVATTYRLTEHEHYVTQNVPHLVQLQPEPFVELPPGLAAERGIVNGDFVNVRSKRGMMHVRALVSNRFGQLDLGGTKVWQIGIPIHWGFVGISAELHPDRSSHWLANALTPFVGDANSRTPEFKAFLVQVEKA